MKKSLILVVLGCFLLLLSCKKDDVPTPDYSSFFVGTWVATKLTQNGQLINVSSLQNVNITNTFTKTSTNKVSMNLIAYLNGQTSNVALNDLEIKANGSNNYELVIPAQSGGNLYVTLANGIELKVGGYTGGTAFEYVFTK